MLKKCYFFQNCEIAKRFSGIRFSASSQLSKHRINYCNFLNGAKVYPLQYSVFAPCLSPNIYLIVPDETVAAHAKYKYLYIRIVFSYRDFFTINISFLDAKTTKKQSGESAISFKRSRRKYVCQEYV